MTLVIDLSEEEEARIRADARAAGFAEADYARRVLVGDLPARKPLTGAEALEMWKQEGVLGLFSDRPPTAEFAAQLRRDAEMRGGIS